MTNPRDFDLGDILSITTGRLVSPRHIDGVYDILGHMTGNTGLMTHQLPRASDEMRPALLTQHPDLAGVPVPDEFRDEAHVVAWLAEQKATYGAARPVEQPAGKHKLRDALTELAGMMGGRL